MFKKILVSFTLFVLLFSTGCTPTEQDFLEYQNSNFETRATLEFNGDKYSVFIEKIGDNSGKITFEQPERLKGITIETDGESLFYSVGKLKLPLSFRENNPMANVLKLFDLSKDDLVSTEPGLLNGVKVNIAKFKQDFGNVSVYLATESGLPLRMEADINNNGITINFSEFKSVGEK